MTASRLRSNKHIAGDKSKKVQRTSSLSSDEEWGSERDAEYSVKNTLNAAGFLRLTYCYPPAV